MSAYLCENEHFEFLVSAGLFVRDYLPRTMAESNRQVQYLKQENIASLRYRYAEQYAGWTDDGIAADSDVGPQPAYTIHTYQRDCRYFQNRIIPLTTRIAQVFKAIACYEYQSCEHLGWKTSEARSYCHALRVAWCTKLPGYAQAEWGSPSVDFSNPSPCPSDLDRDEVQEDDRSHVDPKALEAIHLQRKHLLQPDRVRDTAVHGPTALRPEGATSSRF